MMKKLLLAMLFASTFAQPYAIASSNNQERSVSLLNSQIKLLTPQLTLAETNGYTCNKELLNNPRSLSQAKSFNTQGYRLYKQGMYHKALPLFHRATQADENYMYGQYNFACTASILLSDFNCRHNEALLNLAKPDNIISALQKTVELNPERLSKIKTDPDLALVRQSYRYYHEILDYSNTNDGQLMAMLQNIDWQASGMRFYHSEPVARLAFDKDGQVKVIKSTLVEGDIPEGSLPWTHSSKSGHYQVNNGTITLTFGSADNQQQITGGLNEEGVLIFVESGSQNILPVYHYQHVWNTPCEG